jgi:RNA polymerase sigma-70 factor (ECF subfamily)
VAEDVIVQMFDDGAKRWPRVRVELSALREHCRRALRGVSEEEASVHGAELYLCCACALGNHEAIDAMRREGGAVVRAAIGHVSGGSDFIEETGQELWHDLLFAPDPKIRKYSGRGSLRAWLRVVATRFSLDRCRAARIESSGEMDLAERIAAEPADPALGLLRSRFGSAFQEALEQAIDDLSSADRNLLRLQLRRCTVDQIGRIYGVHRATAARWLARARASALDGARRRIGASAPWMTDSTFASIARDLGSELDLPLSRSSDETSCSEPGYLS